MSPTLRSSNARRVSPRLAGAGGGSAAAAASSSSSRSSSRSGALARGAGSAGNDDDDTRQRPLRATRSNNGATSSSNGSSGARTRRPRGRTRTRAVPPSGKRKKADEDDNEEETTSPSVGEENNSPPANEGEKCCICLEVSDPTEAASLNGCDHSYCFSCIESWAERENTCPQCKERFTRIERVGTTGANGGSSKGPKRGRGGRFVANSRTVGERDQSPETDRRLDPLHGLFMRLGSLPTSGDSDAMAMAIARQIFSGLRGRLPIDGMDPSRGSSVTVTHSGPIGPSIVRLVVQDVLRGREDSDDDDE